MTLSLNLMNDPRVYRGSNIQHAYEYHHPITAGNLAATQFQSQSNERYTLQARREERTKLELAEKIRPKPRSVADLHNGIVIPKIRQRIPLENFLEDHDEQPAQINLSTQTDFFQKHPKEVTFLPAKTGVDMEIQVETADLFDISQAEIDLASLISDCVSEQSLMEVRQEEELKWLLKRQKEMREKAMEEQRQAEALVAIEQQKVEEYRKALARATKLLEEEALCAKRITALKNSIALARSLNEFAIQKIPVNARQHAIQSSTLQHVLPSLFTSQNITQRAESISIVDSLVAESMKV